MPQSGAIIAGKYRLESELGAGGMGAVWRATHVDLGRAVALKFVLGDTPPDESIARFLREARSAASVRHRNVVDVLDFGRDESGAPYLVMECLEGESLESRLKREPKCSAHEIVEWIAGALSGLAAIHDAGIIHRDLKPGNIFLARDADGIVVKVLDFGIARTEEPAGATLTHSMQTLGTPHYMSPEQVRSAKIVDARSDLYSMAVILYQCFSGRLPFEGPSATAIIAAIVTDEPLPIATHCPELAPALAGVVHRGMVREVAHRFPDARAMRRALLEAIGGAVTGGSTQTARPLGIATTLPMGPSPLMDPPAPRPDASEGFAAADTAAMSQLPEMSARPGRAAQRPIAAPPASADRRPPKSGRRGFFALFAAFSSVAVVGLAAMAGGSMMLGGSQSAEAPSVAPAAPGAAPPAARAGGAGAPAAARAVLTPALSLAEVARRYRELAADARPCVLFAPAGERWAAVSADACAERSAALRSSLLRPGESAASAEEVETSDARVPQLLRTTVSSNYRTGPGVENTLIGTFATRTLVVGIDDPAGAPQEEGRSPWIRVAAAEGYEGWMAARLAAPWEGCVPSSVDLGGPAALTSRVQVPIDGVMVDGLVIVHADVLRVVTTDASCALQPLAETRLPGREVDDWFVTSTEQDAGLGLLVVGTRARGVRGDGRVQWRALRIDRALAVVWTVELFSSQTLTEARRDLIGGPFRRGPERRDGYWPLRIRRAHSARAREFYVWDESRGTLVLDGGPDEGSDEPAPREDGPAIPDETSVPVGE